ncbi:MAG: hypothetical protein HeimC3_07070 [Candidatus Heimdallarchaeota archaeon LC_3]|nr:MAG: hypothetical protein HeimC3_07070 [Candidatus Heimdallarchaeota archaeon LC_3]
MNIIQNTIIDFIKDLLPIIAIILSIAFFFIALYLYKSDSLSKFNLLFSLSLISISIAFFVFPLGSTFSIPILSTRLLNTFGYLSLVLLTWSMSITYLGEENWDKKYYVIIYFMIYIIITSAVWLPNSIAVDSGDIQLSDSLVIISVIFSSILILSIFFFLFISYKNSTREKEIRLQLLFLILGLSMIVFALVLGYSSEIFFENQNFDSLSLFIAGIGFFLIIYAMFQDLTLSRIKIVSALNRAQKYLDKGSDKEIKNVNRILHHSQSLAKKMKLIEAEISVMLARINLSTLLGQFSNANKFIVITEELILRNKREIKNYDLDKYKKQVNMQTTGLGLEKLYDGSKDAKKELKNCIDYIDKVIYHFKSESGQKFSVD